MKKIALNIYIKMINIKIKQFIINYRIKTFIIKIINKIIYLIYKIIINKNI